MAAQRGFLSQWFEQIDVVVDMSRKRFLSAMRGGMAQSGICGVDVRS